MNIEHDDSVCFKFDDKVSIVLQDASKLEAQYPCLSQQSWS